jgi:hypothetical protein
LTCGFVLMDGAAESFRGELVTDWSRGHVPPSRGNVHGQRVVRGRLRHGRHRRHRATVPDHGGRTAGRMNDHPAKLSGTPLVLSSAEE